MRAALHRWGPLPCRRHRMRSGGSMLEGPLRAPSSVSAGFARRVALELENFAGPIPVADPVKAAQFDGTTARLVVEVPSPMSVILVREFRDMIENRLVASYTIGATCGLTEVCCTPMHAS